MYHSVRFTVGSSVKNSWDDWYLVPSSRPVINPPEPKYVSVDIPGANGSIDLTEVVSGEVVYENRTGTIEFIVWNDKPMEWFELYSTIMDYMHGRTVQISLEDEISDGGTVPDYYYEGRCKVSGWESGAHYSTISFEYDLYPYKYATTATTKTVTLSSSYQNFTFANNGSMTVVPKFTVPSGGSATVKIGSSDVALSTGENTLTGLRFTTGNNVVQIKGSGSLTVTYREGRL